MATEATVNHIVPDIIVINVYDSNTVFYAESISGITGNVLMKLCKLLRLELYTE